MTYLDEIEKTLRERLSGLDEGQREGVVEYVKIKVLDSYRNGANKTRKSGIRDKGKSPFKPVKQS